MQTNKLLLIVIMDIVLLPVFHVFSYPVKIFFIPLFYNLISKWSNKHTIKILLLFLLLLSVIFFGALYQYFLFDVGGFGYTFFLSVSIFLGYVGYSFGHSIGSNKLDYVVYVAIMYSLLNIMIVIIPELFTLFKVIYSIPDRAWHVSRNPGVFVNPNVSALVVNILFVSTFLGLKYRLINTSAAAIIIQCVVSFVAIVSFNSIAHIVLFFFI